MIDAFVKAHPDFISSATVIYTVMKLVVLIVGLRFGGPTQLVDRVRDARDGD